MNPIVAAIFVSLCQDLPNGPQVTQIIINWVQGTQPSDSDLQVLFAAGMAAHAKSAAASAHS